MTDELRDVRQHFPILGLVAAAMRRAEKDQTERRILDRLVSRLQPGLEQCLDHLSVADRLTSRPLVPAYLFHHNPSERVGDEYERTMNLLIRNQHLLHPFLHHIVYLRLISFIYQASQ
jgi:hypothetical protein